MADKNINWTRVFYLVGACWLISFVLYVLSEVQDFPLNPVPKVGAYILGIVVHGYIGAGDRYELLVIIAYATLAGVWMAWAIGRKFSPATIISITIGVHLVLSILSLPLLMLAGGR